MDTTRGIRAATPSASREFYQAYLNSSGWRTTRNFALREANYRCSHCGSKRDLEVHHKSYDHLGAEPLCDLEVLCATCHRDETLENPSQGLGIYLKLVSQIVTKDPWARVSDVADEVKSQCVLHHIPQDVERIATAINVVCGTRLKGIPSARETVADYTEDRPFTKQEAREMLCRLDGLRGLIKTMPEGPRRERVIDIYGPVPRAEDAFDYDRY